MGKLGKSTGKPLPKARAERVIDAISDYFDQVTSEEINGIPVAAVFEDFESGEYFRITLKTTFYVQEES